MKTRFRFLIVPLALLVVACGGKDEKRTDGFQMERSNAPEPASIPAPAPDAQPASQRIALDNKGVGPVTELNLPAEINPVLAAEGEAVYNQMCLACHRIGKKFIGPAPNGILDRRSPEWVMNMILNPQEMVKEDPLARDLLMEFNGSPMANQGLTRDQARAVLEYFRTLK